MTRVRALAVGAEVYPLVKTGGLADVMGALPAALVERALRDEDAGRAWAANEFVR